jgi:hypothetical protein
MAAESCLGALIFLSPHKRQIIQQLIALLCAKEARNVYYGARLLRG